MVNMVSNFMISKNDCLTIRICAMIILYFYICQGSHLAVQPCMVRIVNVCNYSVGSKISHHVGPPTTGQDNNNYIIVLCLL